MSETNQQGSDMFGAIISGIIGLTGIIASGVAGRKARKSQEKYATGINQLSQENWKQKMAFREKEAKRDRMQNSIINFQNMVNQSDRLKNTAKNLWSGR